MKLKSKCCKKFKKKNDACRKCPLLARLNPKERKRLLKKAKKQRKRAAGACL